jgi:hypothetical protein
VNHTTETIATRATPCAGVTGPRFGSGGVRDNASDTPGSGPSSGEDFVVNEFERMSEVSLKINVAVEGIAGFWHIARTALQWDGGLGERQLKISERELCVLPTVRMCRQVGKWPTRTLASLALVIALVPGSR